MQQDAAQTTQAPVISEPFNFDADFQLKVAALAIRDNEFLRRTSHVLKPEFFENEGQGKLIAIALDHFQKYNCAPDKTSLAAQVKDRIANKSIRRDILPAIVQAMKDIRAADLSNGTYVEDKVVAFARRQGMANAIMTSVDLLNQGKFSKIEEAVQEALSIGINEDGAAYNYFSDERVRERMVERVEKMSGVRPPQGITSGDEKLDNVLYHRGWGRRELTSFMGAAKSGKTTALIHFGQIATFVGFNVLYCTLEVGAKIIADRLDASISGTLMRDLGSSAASVAQLIQQRGKESGQFIIHEYGSGTFTPNMLRQLVQRYKTAGRNPDGSYRPPIVFDLIIVDYADIMAPNYRVNDPIENSKQVYVDLRAIAFEENCAMLTATQTNREGSKQVVAKAEHVAEDYNKVRTVDLMISINKTEEEASNGEARLYFAASRNQESGFTIVIKQDLARMKFLEKVLRVE